MPYRILLAAVFDPSLLARLEGDERFATIAAPTTSEEDLIARLEGIEILVTRYHNTITRRVLQAASGLEVIVQGTAGLDNIDIEAAREIGIAVRSTAGGNANAVAELVLGQIISLTRTLPSYDRMVRAGEWNREDCFHRSELRAHRLGIAGFGRVGTRLAELMAAVGVRCLAFDPYVADQEFANRGVERTDTLDALLSTSDILTLHVPLTEETKAMIGARELDRLPKGAFVVNTSRGAVLDTEAALAALRRGSLGGLALDVFETEPPQGIAWPSDPRLILTPHIAGCSREAKEAIGQRIYELICNHCGLEPQ